MKVYALVFEIGIMSGHKELIGVYSTIEKAVENKKRHQKKTYDSDRHYSINEIEIDKTVNVIYQEW